MRPSLALTAIAGAVLFASPGIAQTAPAASDVSVKAEVAGTTSGPAVAAPAAEAPASAPTLEPKSETGDRAAEAAKPKPVPPSLIAKINLSTQKMDVIVDGQSKHSWAISSGRAGYASPRGTYRVNWTAKMWYSRKYDMAPMPHAVFFTGGVAIHATSSVGLLGRPASHGCIRLAPANAAAFYALVQKHGNARTQIQVFGSGPSDQMAIP
jgi:lipoprotein-anchoring transpeptidase ErfK/SrfK